MADEMRAAWNNIKTIDPDGEGYKKLCSFLDALDYDMLYFLSGAQIKFVSKLALNRVLTRL